MKLSKNNLERDIEKKKRIIKILELCDDLQPTTFEEYVMYLYVKTQKGVKVATILDEEGYRVETKSSIGSRKFKSNDVTDIIIDEYKNNNTVLGTVAFTLYKYNFGTYKLSDVIKSFEALEPFLFSHKLDINKQHLTDMLKFNALYSRKKN